MLDYSKRHQQFLPKSGFVHFIQNGIPPRSTTAVLEYQVQNPGCLFLFCRVKEFLLTSVDFMFYLHPRFIPSTHTDLHFPTGAKQEMLIQNIIRKFLFTSILTEMISDLTHQKLVSPVSKRYL